MVRRLEVMPTDEALATSVAADAAGRNKELLRFIRMIHAVDGPYTFLIDAPWGDGKTFFVKSVGLVLSALNCNMTIDNTIRRQLELVAEQLDDIDEPYYVYYFNAWENDYIEDPTAILFANMAATFDQSSLLKKVSVRECATEVADAALALTPFSGAASAITAAISGASLVEACEKRQEVRARISELVEDVLREVANKLIVIVDDLDRCNPTFAVKLLEQIKSLFDSDKVIVVLAADSVQLSKAIGGAYGPGFDSSHFVERFYDERLSLSPVDGYAIAYGASYPKTADYYDELVAEVLSVKSLTPRDMMRLRKLRGARAFVESPDDGSAQVLLIKCAVIPLLIFMERDDLALYRNITRGRDFDGFFEYAKKYESFLDMARRVLSCHVVSSNLASETVDIDEIQAFTRSLCIVLFSNDRYSDEFDSAVRRVGVRNSLQRYSDICKTLSFESF